MKKGGCFSYILVILISSIAAFIVSGALDNMAVEIPNLGDDTIEGILADMEERIQDKISRETETEETEPAETEGISVVVPDAPEEPILYYDQLSAEEQKIYNVVYAGLVSGEKSFRFEGVPYDAYYAMCYRVICAITYDHPELFWVQCGYRFTETHTLFEKNGDVDVEFIYYSYWEYSLDKKQKIQALENAANAVAAQASQYGTDYERIQFVHDYLVENACYDFDGLNEYYKSMHDSACEYIFSAYGCLVNGKTVCSGYAKAFQMIMQKLGYNCLYVVGDAGEAHAWNCIFIEDEGYFLDVTWDDPDFEYDEPAYEYFCITSESLAKTHTLDQEFTIPECTAEELNYFLYNGYRMDTYDFRKVCEVVEKQKGQHIISMQFTNQDAITEAYSELLTYGKCYDIPTLSDVADLQYSVNEDHYTIRFYLP